MEKNIYKIGKELFITSDEKIKEGDWFMSDFNSFPIHNIKELSEREGTLGWEQKDLKNNLKIILTTDPDLIKEGVQAIDDEFLEWFVKNPSCEFIKVTKVDYLTNRQYRIYNLPQEEPKQDLEKEMFELEQELDIPSSMRWHNSKPKQETLEEVLPKNSNGKYSRNEIEKAFESGAKWQAERMYSEEEVKDLIIKALTHDDYDLCGSLATRDWEIRPANFNVWFEHNKK